MKIVIFGGSGFLGSHLADRASGSGHKVTIFDRMASAWRQPGQEMILGDILDRPLVEKAVQGAEAVYNFAGLADLEESAQAPLETINYNVLGNAYLLEAAHRAGAGRFIYASSLYVNSDSGGFYRWGKAAAEQYIEEFQKSFGLNYTILRYGSLYGPRSDQRNGIYRILKEALETGRITYRGSRKAARQYIHVEDAAQASVDILSPQFINSRIVLTGQESMAVPDLFRMIEEILGRSLECRYLEQEPGVHYNLTPYSFRPSPAKTYSPLCQTELGQGLLTLLADIYAELERPGQ